MFPFESTRDENKFHDSRLQNAMLFFNREQSRYFNQCYTFRVEKNLIFISESVKDVGNFKLSMEYSMLKGFQVNGREFVVEDGSISLERRSICSGLGPRWSDTIKG